MLILMIINQENSIRYYHMKLPSHDEKGLCEVNVNSRYRQAQWIDL